MPETPVEEENGSVSQTVLTVLREVIGNSSIVPADDFYLAGGHSLLIVRIVRRLRTEYGLALDFRQFGINSQVGALIRACRPVDGPTARPSRAGSA